MIKGEELRELIASKGLKVTPQRKWVLEAVYILNNHPTADQIINFINNHNNSITPGSTYRVLDDLVNAELIKKVKTDSEIMRYDGILENHHHLYCDYCEYIEDYNDPELDALLNDYFKKHPIHDFNIKSFNLTINGSFSTHKNHTHKKLKQ